MVFALAMRFVMKVLEKKSLSQRPLEFVIAFGMRYQVLRT